MTPSLPLRARQKFGKYKIVRRLAKGGFAEVYAARDTIEDIPVALKIPHAHVVTPETLGDFRKEARLTARLDHPNILPIKTAEHVDGHFVIVQPLGRGTLADRLARRLSTRLAADFSEQILAALAHAHKRRIIHCDVKPENFILFDGDRLRLADFGIAKVALRTIPASGSGTVGFLAPEQAMGKPSVRSDVFAAGLILYRLFAGTVPEWPFDWPPPRYDRIKRADPRLGPFLAKALEVDAARRYPDASAMLAAFRRIKPALVGGRGHRGRRRAARNDTGRWKRVRMKEFQRAFGRRLGMKHACDACSGPVAEAMLACPWCGRKRPRHRGGTDFPAQCPRCARGVKLDWRFCAWCHGAAIGPLSERAYTDVRYAERCASCRGDLMRFSRYCPWCRAKVRRPSRVEGSRDRCPGCRSGVVTEFWDWCPWCGRRLRKGVRRGR